MGQRCAHSWRGVCLRVVFLIVFFAFCRLGAGGVYVCCGEVPAVVSHGCADCGLAAALFRCCPLYGRAYANDSLTWVWAAVGKTIRYMLDVALVSEER